MRFFAGVLVGLSIASSGMYILTPDDFLNKTVEALDLTKVVLETVRDNVDKETFESIKKELTDNVSKKNLNVDLNKLLVNY